MSFYKPGQWNAICDRCGLQFKSGELRKDWQGLMVDDKCYETRHPQDLIKIHTDTSATPWTRPDTSIVSVILPVCTFIGGQGVAGAGVAGCMVAGKNTIPI